MEIKEAIQVLKDHNAWRRYDGEINQSPQMTDPKKLGIAIDTVVNKFENLFLSSVRNRFNSKYTPPFRVGRKQGKAVLDANGIEVVFFSNSEEQAKKYCDYLNGF